jgi:hypothetical protein
MTISLTEFSQILLNAICVLSSHHGFLAKAHILTSELLLSQSAYFHTGRIQLSAVGLAMIDIDGSRIADVPTRLRRAVFFCPSYQQHWVQETLSGPLSNHLLPPMSV